MIAIGSVVGCAMAACAFDPVETFTHWVGNRIIGAL
jgi:hypothetical protein